MKADGFIAKDEIELLLAAINAVMSGGVYISPKNTKRLGRQIRENEKSFQELLDKDLTPKEKINLRTLAKEPSTKGAASESRTNLSTFKSRNTNILRKFGMETINDVLQKFGKYFK